MRSRIVAEAKTWIDTPYHHQAGVKGVGVDCAYLVGHIAKNCGLIPEFKVEPYAMEWHWHSKEEVMCQILESFGCKEKKLENLKPGDILAFQYGRVCSHLGVYVGDGMFIHAHIKSGKVVLNSLAGDFEKRLKRAYSFPTKKKARS